MGLFSSSPLHNHRNLFLLGLFKHLCHLEFGPFVLKYSSLLVTLIMSHSLWFFLFLLFYHTKFKLLVVTIKAHYLVFFILLTPSLPCLLPSLYLSLSSLPVAQYPLCTWHHLPSFKTSLGVTPVQCLEAISLLMMARFSSRLGIANGVYLFMLLVEDKASSWLWLADPDNLILIFIFPFSLYPSLLF